MVKNRQQIVVTGLSPFDIASNLPLGAKGYIVKWDGRTDSGRPIYLCHFPRVKGFKGHGKDKKHWFVIIED